MALSEEQIQKLLEWFAIASETRKKWINFRKKAYEENHKWIQPDVIRKMAEKELESRFLEYFKNGGGRQTLIQMNRNKIIKDKKRFRDTLLYLLDENVSIKDRLDEVLIGKNRIAGFGKAIATSFLMDFDIAKYCLWNNKTEMGFSVLEWDLYERKNSPGEVYLIVLENLKRLRELMPEFNFTFEDIDLFLHTISAEDEGKIMVRQIKQEVIIPKSPDVEQGEIKIFTLRAKVPWDKLSNIISGVFKPLKDKGNPPEITLEIKGISDAGFDRDILDNKVRETLQQIGATIEKWEEK